MHVVNTGVGEMPEGARLSDDDDIDGRPEDDPHKALDINLDEPLAPNEVLPTRHHRVITSQLSDNQSQPGDEISNEKSNKKKDKKKTSKTKKNKKGDKSKKKSKKDEDNILDLKTEEDNIISAEATEPEIITNSNHVNGISEDLPPKVNNFSLFIDSIKKNLLPLYK